MLLQPNKAHKEKVQEETVLLSVNDVSLKSETKTILDRVSFSLRRGRITTLIGPNGAGKTTLLKVILGLRNPTSGAVMGRDKLRLGYVPQKIHVNPLLPLTVSGFLDISDCDKKAFAYAERLNVTHLLKRQLHDLSGGELQKVLLIQSIAHGPNLLILDEPTQGLDITSQKDIHDFIIDLARKENMGILHVSHDLHLVMAKSDEVLCLNHHLCCVGHPEDIKHHPEYLSLFEGGIPPTLAPYHHHHDHRHDHCEGGTCEKDHQS